MIGNLRLVFVLIAAMRSVLFAQQVVDVVPVRLGTIEQTLRLPADLFPYQSVVIHARVTGFVDEIPVDRGSRVKRGDLIARLSAPELVAQLREAEARILEAEAERMRAQAQLDAARKTYEQLEQAAKKAPGAVAQIQLIQAEREVATSEALVKAAATSVQAARSRLEQIKELAAYLEVRAPFDGIVTERYVHPGALVGPGVQPSQPLVKLQQTDRLRLVVSVPEADIAGMPQGKTIEFTVKPYPQRVFHGRLVRISHAVDPSTRAMPVELDVTNRSGALAPGLYAEVRWPVTRGPSRLVPRSAVVRTTERQFVIRVRDGKAEWVDVEIGERQGELVEVFGNLEPGDLVVLRASDEIRPGMALQARQAQTQGNIHKGT